MVQTSEIKEIVTSTGETLSSLSMQGPVMLVFLRQFGCVFCKEALIDIAVNRAMWEKRGVKIVLTHMSDNDTANEYFNKFGLHGITHISDEDCELYAKFGLTKGSAGQLFGLKNWIRGFEISGSGKAFPSLRQIGDGFQMPGIFLIQNDEIKQSFIHKTASDRPDYNGLIDCCSD